MPIHYVCYTCRNSFNGTRSRVGARYPTCPACRELSPGKRAELRWAMELEPQKRELEPEEEEVGDYWEGWVVGYRLGLKDAMAQLVEEVTERKAAE